MPYLKSEKIKLYYQFIECKNKERKRTPLVIFIHGFNSSSNQFISLAKDSKRKFDSLLFDLPHHGLSKSNKKLNWKILKESLELIFKELKLLELENKEIFVVGHSLGGALATLWLSLFPETKKALLVTPLTYYSNFSKEEGEKLKKLLLPENIEEAKITLKALIPSGISEFWDKNLNQIAKTFFKHTKEKFEILKELINKVILNKKFLKEKLKTLYEEKSKKIILISAEFDEFLFKNSLENIAKELNLKVIKLKKLGHGCFFENKDIFLKIINKLVEKKL